MHVMTCRNERCKWLNQNWLIQENRDGSIPERKAGPKEYNAMSEDDKAFARAMIEQNKIELQKGELGG